MKTFGQVLLGIGGFVLLLVVFPLLGFYGGAVQNLYDSTIGLQHENVQRQVYEQSQSYVEGKLQELSKDYAEYNQATDPTAKQALLTTVRTSFAEFDSNKVTDPVLQNFLLKARGE